MTNKITELRLFDMYSSAALMGLSARIGYKEDPANVALGAANIAKEMIKIRTELEKNLPDEGSPI